MASDNPSLSRPRIGYARLLIAGNMPNHSTIMDPESVITLGHSARQPLMCPASELVDRLEPHGLIWSMAHRGSDGEQDMPGGAGVYPGWGRLGTGRVLYRVLTQAPDRLS